MKYYITTIFMFTILSTVSYSQKVETLVKGPSTFDDGLAIDEDGFIYASRYYGDTISKISPSGEVSIFSSGFGSPNIMAFDMDGYLIVPNATGNKVHKVSKDGTKEILIETIENPTGIAVDTLGNIYISQYSLSKISKLDTEGNLTTYLSGGLLDGPVAMMFGENGELFIGNFNNGRVLKHSAGSEMIIVGDIPGWLGSFTMKDSVIYATSIQGNQIYRITTDGKSQTVFAGTGEKGSKDGPVDKATFDSPNGIALSNSGDTLYVSDFETRSLRMITDFTPKRAWIDIPDTLDFGEINFDTDQTHERNLTIRNTGNDTLTIGQISISDSSFYQDKSELKIMPYSSDTLQIGFRPNTVGEVSSVLTMYSNAQEETASTILVARVISSTGNTAQSEKPQKMKLFQNYPNPFNPSANINFALSEPSDISLEVFDIQGRKVATLAEGKTLSGEHTVNFDGTNLSSGIYYCRLEAKDESEVILMTLIK